MALARGLTFDASLPESGPWLVGDRTRLGQVVLNLIGNAVKFTERGGIRLDATTDGDQVVVSVTDTGPGIDPDEQRLIFTEFHRSNRSAAGARGGLGLGLAIARQLVQLHGGSIEVTSPVADGHGSRFWFAVRTIPAPVAHGSQPDPLPVDAVTMPLEPDRVTRLLARHRVEPDPGLQEPIVLVVDDDPDVLALHARIVAEAGARAIRASSGAQALAVLARDRPDLVLLDLSMPDGDGFTVLESLRARDATRDVPVIVVTGQSVADAELARLGTGVRTILRKGVFTPRETAARIQAVLSGDRSLASPTQQVVRRAVHDIEQRFATPLSREDIARHVAISPDYLTDCFQQELGLTPMAYLSRCRIRRARELLDTTDDTVTSIALAVGFSEVSHFTRTFHREVGVSPRAYRRGNGPER
jgi:AraC-like DNA-binding protein